VTIGTDHRVELLPGVYASVGMSEDDQAKLSDEDEYPLSKIKVALEAPRNIRILRDELYGVER
jgi:hypothetical protein